VALRNIGEKSGSLKSLQVRAAAGTPLFANGNRITNLAPGDPCSTEISRLIEHRLPRYARPRPSSFFLPALTNGFEPAFLSEFDAGCRGRYSQLDEYPESASRRPEIGMGAPSGRASEAIVD